MWEVLEHNRHDSRGITVHWKSVLDWYLFYRTRMDEMQVQFRRNFSLDGQNAVKHWIRCANGFTILSNWTKFGIHNNILYIQNVLEYEKVALYRISSNMVYIILWQRNILVYWFHILAQSKQYWGRCKSIATTPTHKRNLFYQLLEDEIPTEFESMT